jgi:SAM-dependent methyltransferase
MAMIDRRRKCRELMHRYYADAPSREQRLDEVVSSLCRPTDVLLDAGCGSTLALLERYAPKVAVAIGIDLGMPGRALHGAEHVVCGDLGHIPLDRESVDVIVSRSVVEHLDFPDAVFAEFARVLRRGGKLVFTTPNKYYYSCLFAWMTPERLKQWYFATVFGEDAYDHFPVRYRANTPARLRAIARASGLTIAHLEAIEHYPYYLMFSPMLFRLGIVYDRVVERLGADILKSTWLVVMEKS